jgi:hypothetical protein
LAQPINFNQTHPIQSKWNLGFSSASSAMVPRILPLLQTPLKATWNVAGKLTETSYWPALDSSNKIVLFLVPGNPGLVDYYTTFCEAIHRTVSDAGNLSLEILAGNTTLTKTIVSEQQIDSSTC